MSGVSTRSKRITIPGRHACRPKPAHGVVDPDCRVWGIDNLYVAGSSVFPTNGHVNPTLSIVALAVRLADHLRIELKKSS